MRRWHLMLGNMMADASGPYVSAYRYKAETTGGLAHLQLDLVVGTRPPYLSGGGMKRDEPDIHYAAVDIYGTLAENLYAALSNPDHADMATQEEYQ